MAASVKVLDMLCAYHKAHEAYENFISMGVNQVRARNAVALLLWLEQMTDVQAIQCVRKYNDHGLYCLAAEANSILDCLRGQLNGLAFPEIPFISSLCLDGSINPAFFVFRQDLAVQGVANILDGVGPLVFDDRLYRLYNRYITGLFPRFPELNAPYTISQVTVPEDWRSMFITFSKGQPVEREEIFHYFKQ
jgi:hypothetical protein